MRRQMVTTMYNYFALEAIQRNYSPECPSFDRRCLSVVSLQSSVCFVLTLLRCKHNYIL